MKRKRLILLFLFCFIIALFVGCGSGTEPPPGDGPGEEDPPETETEDETLAENYDFGDPASWEGDMLKVTDLGDCLLDAYPYDDKYDWGQSILWDEEAGKYKMWWCRNSGYDTIWYAESTDLKNWTNAQKLMTVTENTTWIKMHVGKPAVLKVDGTYVMYFEAPATLYEGGSKEFDNNVFRATSQDGIHWEIYEGAAGEPYPVIRMTDEDLAASAEQYASQGRGFYGIGQPSVLYRDGLYYVYCTYSLVQGDRMYVFTSEDGITFSEGKEVFTRANCGVKYNTLTEKFMLAYEYTEGGISRVYYMESDDGYTFTYSNLVEASKNTDVLSTGSGFVRCYPDFVSDGHGNVNTYTMYVAYMEGTMADSGNDWRQYSSTWDIHIAAVNLAPYANRTQVLPDGHVLTDETIVPYRAAHREYEELLVGIPRLASAPTVDGVKDDLYSAAAEYSVSRAVSDYRAVPNDTTARFYAGYTEEALYVLVEVQDALAHDSDVVSILLDEKRYAADGTEVVRVDAYRNGTVTVTDGAGTALDSAAEAKVVATDSGYIAEIRLPWRLRTSFDKYDGIGFDCYVFDNRDSTDFKSLIAWNDCHASYDYKRAGELYFEG